MTHDERFEVSAANRRGAHRARPNPLLSALPLVALAVVIAGVIGLSMLLFGDRNVTSAGTSAAPSLVATASLSGSAPSGAATDSASVAPSSDGSSLAAGGEVDRSIVLNVYNGSNPPVTGLAKQATTPLKESGWPIGEVQTWSGQQVSQTTIYYAEPTQLNTAQAVVEVLGTGTVMQDPDLARNGLTVVLGNDFQP